MRIQIDRGTALFGVALLVLACCGGGVGGDASSPPAAPTTTNVSTTVVKGAFKNALVCLDKNSNGKCDRDEVRGKTNTAGTVTLDVPNADVGKYPIVALVGTDAVDSDNGPVTIDAADSCQYRREHGRGCQDRSGRDGHPRLAVRGLH